MFSWEYGNYSVGAIYAPFCKLVRYSHQTDKVCQRPTWSFTADQISPPIA